MKEKDARELIVKYSSNFNDRYYKAYGMIIMRVDDDTYLMSRPGLFLESIKDSDLTLYDLNTGDVGKFLQSRNDINVMIFACTEPSALFSQNNNVLKPALYDLAALVGTDVPVIENASAKELLSALKNRDGCLVRGKGIMSISENIKDAISISKIIEKSVEAEIFAEKIGGVKHLSAQEALETRNKHNRNYSKVNTEEKVAFVNIGPEEFQVRNNLIDYSAKLRQIGLIQGSWGNLSVRLNDDEMLISPSAMEYENIRTEDIVKVNIKTLEYDSIQRIPSTEYKLHAAIYREHPEWTAIVRTHSHGLSVFAAAQAGFRITDSHLHELIGDVSVSEHATPCSDEFIASIVKELRHNNVCVIANRGPIFCAKTLEDSITMADSMDKLACSLLGYDEPLTKTDSNKED